MKSPQLFTEVSWRGFPIREKAHRHDGILTLGSCFSDNIGLWLQHHGFTITVNPFGTLYNPLSLVRALSLLCAEGSLTERDLSLHDGKYLSFMHHSRYTSSSIEETLHRINQDLIAGREMLLQGHWLFLTLGTAFYYTLNVTGEVVANCHKLNPNNFSFKRIEAMEAAEALAVQLESIWQRNPNLQVVFTVSPIRYKAYGAVENARSKAELLLTTRLLQERFPDRVTYFPAYEIMIDELRDYRFYVRDLVHPSEVAIDIIRERLLLGWLHPSEEGALREADKAYRRSLHIPKGEL